jgi:hypothetical protein
VSETVSHVDDDPWPPPDDDRWAPPDDAPGSDGDHQEHDPVAALRELWGCYGDQDWSRSPPPPQRWLLTCPDGAGFLPRGKVGMLAGAGGAGKTTALLQLAVSVATGGQWLGSCGFNVPPAEAGRVCLLLAEEDKALVQDRLLKIKATLDIQEDAWNLVLERLFILPMVGKPSAQLIESTGERNGKTRETPFFKAFRERLTETGAGWSLIILDPLSRLATAETETDNHHATRFIATIEKLVNVPGNPAVLVAHHSNKSARGGLGAGSANAARGASGLTDGVRWLATLDYPAPAEKGEEAKLTLSLAKHNYSPPTRPRPLVHGPGGVLTVDGPKAEGQAAASTPASKPSKPSKASERNGKPSKPEDDEDDPNTPI